jgi:hypothetical protein
MLLAILGLATVAGAQEFFEDFEAYAADSEMHGQGGWKGWDNAPSAGAPVSGQYAYNGSNSVDIIGAADLVHEFDIAGGRWEVKAMQYIPSGTTGTTWFILLNTYSDGGTKDWSLQTQFNLGSGSIAYWHGGSGQIIYDQWVELKYIIDLDNNTVDKYYNGEYIVTDQWDDGSSGTFQCIDLFGNGASSVYYDDISVSQYFIYTAHEPTPADGDVGVTAPLLRWTAGDTATFHDVYLGTSPDLTEADLLSAKQMFTMYYVATGLEPGVTYYWRVDETTADMSTTYTGDVWSFTTAPLTAHSPDPADGYRWGLPDVTLTWQPGQGASLHTLYFSTDANAVASRDATALIGDLPDLSYDVSSLEQGTTHYWAVDETDGDGVKHEGEVWRFSTIPEMAVTNPNLTLWWMLDEGGGTTAVDWSGHGHHGTLNGDAQWVDGYQGTALMFGQDVYVEAAGYEGVAGTDPRTLCAWIKTSVANTNMTIMSWGQNVAGQKWRMRQDGTGGLRIEVNGGYHYGVTNIGDNNWHHVAVTFEDDGTPDAVDTLLYVDGWLDGTAASLDEPINTAATGAVRIGESPWHNAPWQGLIDDARVYNRVLTAEEIQEAMRGNPLLAGNPEPSDGSIADIREVTSLSWSRGDTAASHDVYFGTDKDVVADAGMDSAAYQGNQPGTSFSAAGLVEFGGGEYSWRIDEVEADGTTHPGYVWRFTVPDYLIVDNFERYSNKVGERVFERWVDGVGFTLPEPGHPGNGTGAAVGHDVWDPASPHYNGSIIETRLAADGGQSMPLYYDNAAAPYHSEAQRTWAMAQDWTAEGVDTLVLYVRGIPTNAADPVYIVVEDSLGQTAVVTQPDPDAATATQWIEWAIALSDLADAGVNPAAVKKMTIGVGSPTAPAPGGAGMLLVDDIRVMKAVAEQ